MNTSHRMSSLLRRLVLVGGLVLTQAAAANPQPAAASPAQPVAASSPTTLQFRFWAQGSLGPLSLVVLGHSEDSPGDSHAAVSNAAVSNLLLDASPAAELATLSVWLVALGVLGWAMWRQQGGALGSADGEDTAIMD